MTDARQKNEQQPDDNSRSCQGKRLAIIAHLPLEVVGVLELSKTLI
jgi:hypothetical protein